MSRRNGDWTDRRRAVPFAHPDDPIEQGRAPGARGEKRKMAMSKDVRRVVTTVDKDGKAVVLLDDVNPHSKVRPHGTVTRLLWVADETPTDLRGPADRATREIGIAPPAG